MNQSDPVPELTRNWTRSDGFGLYMGTIPKCLTLQPGVILNTGYQSWVRTFLRASFYVNVVVKL